MDLSMLTNVLLGLAIGLSLGFLGGGGSILTVPALVYVVGQSPHAAVTASLIIVGANAGLGSLFHRSQGSLNWHVAILFGGVGMITAYLAAGLSESIPSTVLLILFAALMLVVGAYMIFGRKPQDDIQDPRGWAVIAAVGAGVGVLTGFLGVGGGFLIVPALVMLVGLPMRQAVGTSLVIIAMNSLAGVLGHMHSATFDVPVIAVFVLSGVVGTFAGARLAKRISPTQLRTSFAIFVLILGAILFVDNMGKLF